MKEYLKAKIDEFETNSKIRTIKGLYWVISDFKKGYQPRTNIVKDGKGDLITDSQSILARWRNHVSQLLNVHGADAVRQRVNTYCKASSAFDVGMAIEKLKSYKSSGIDQISAELIKQGVEQFALRSIKLFILVGLRRNVPEE
jgi:hypothetical protein